MRGKMERQSALSDALQQRPLENSADDARRLYRRSHRDGVERQKPGGVGRKRADSLHPGLFDIGIDERNPHGQGSSQ